MANLRKVIYINEEDYSTLINGDSLVIDGTTYTYEENALYVIKNAGPPEYAETAGYATNAGTSQVAVSDASGNNIAATYEKKPLMIEANESDASSTLESGTYNSITEALALDRLVILKLTCDNNDNEICYLPLLIDYIKSYDGYYFRVLRDVNISYEANINSHDEICFARCTLAKNNLVVHKTQSETISGDKTFTGTVSLGSNATATTPTTTDNDTSVATTAFVHNVVNAIPEITTGQIVGRMHRDNVSGTGNLTITGASGEGFNPNGITAAGDYVVVVYSWSDTKTFGYNISFGSNSYTLSTTDGTISDKRKLTVSAGALWSGSVTTAVSAGTTIIVEIYKAEKTTPALSVGIVALTNLYNDLDGKPTIPNDSNLVHKTGYETINGDKWFTSLYISSNGTGNIKGPVTIDDMGGNGKIILTGDDKPWSQIQSGSKTLQDELDERNNLVTSVNGMTGAVSLSLGDTNTIETVQVNGTALTPDANKAVNVIIPTKTSDLTNDSNFTTLSEVTLTIVNSAPETLDTLNELAAALGDDPNFATTIATQIGNKADKATTLAGYGITDAINTSSTALTKAGDLTAAKFIKSGGTSTQFLKADGSVDSNIYLTSFTETDPTVPSHVKSITSLNISDWNNKLNEAYYVVSVTSDSDITPPSTVSGTANHYYLDIATAYNNGKIPIVILNLNMILPFIGSISEDSSVLFGTTVNLYSYLITMDENTVKIVSIKGVSEEDILLSSEYQPSILTNSDLLLASGDTYEEAFGKLEKAINDNERITAAALVDLDTKLDLLSLDDIPDGNTRKLSNYLPLSGGTMTGAITVAPGDGKGLLFSTTSNINVSGTTNTILGFYNGTYIIGHTAYPVNIRGNATRPQYNGNQLALYSDIPSAVTESTVSGWGFTKNTGTVTGVKINGTTKNPTSGVVDLGTVLTSFTETDPTVPTWAKAASKPTYTAAEVGALPDTYTPPVTSVNGQTGAVNLTIPAAPGTLNTTATIAQSTSSSEALSGNITLHKVAKTGTYNDLIGKPTIPAAQVQSDWNATSGMGVILNKPTIPTVNDATLTIQKNGTTVNTFTANASSNVTANIQVNELPTVSSSDNGKILQVVNGAWALVTPVTVYTGTSTPDNSQGNDGDLYLLTS